MVIWCYIFEIWCRGGAVCYGWVSRFSGSEFEEVKIWDQRGVGFICGLGSPVLSFLWVGFSYALSISSIERKTRIDNIMS